MNKIVPREMDSSVLAYIGDVVYELFIRTFVIQMNPNNKVNKLHQLSVDYVRATNQARVLKSIEEELDEEEFGIVRRARNKKISSLPKNVSLKEYQSATAFEALLGYLYLLKKEDRLNALMEKSLNMIINDENKQEG